uniref:Uncharacterized protein n=1 Tax=Nelumbo nucifera TaxID=4432 RepID=A0A822Z837_NELNU|nr:TPA_asm: hypothetical protein HUJ06_013509 [Nelumbo nucifera]
MFGRTTPTSRFATLLARGVQSPLDLRQINDIEIEQSTKDAPYPHMNEGDDAPTDTVEASTSNTRKESQKKKELDIDEVMVGSTEAANKRMTSLVSILNATVERMGGYSMENVMVDINTTERLNIEITANFMKF